MKEKKVALIGMGNIMFHDEGLGTYLAKYIEANYSLPDNLTIVDGGVMGFSLMTYYQEYDKIIVVGTSSLEGESGSIFRHSAEEMMSQGATRQTANEVEITMMMEICTFHEDMGEAEYIGMIPEDIAEVKNDLTPTILLAMPKLLEVVKDSLHKEDIKIVPKKERVSMGEIIAAAANPRNIRIEELGV